MASAFLVPPGGFAGFSQMTPASRVALGQRSRGPARRRKRRKAKTARRAKRARRTKRTRKMKFGSPAWQKKYKVGRYRR